ncbi:MULTISPECIES: hypothetical protein [Bacteroides]|mgnify:FL=1|nr:MULTISPECIES: hypothetical protein [Bacteroides]NDO60427.1 hypothetical protein [Bacteroides caecimuris]QQR16759.1 hypothetical protein I5Q79_16345 [Bacteroides caecimuris]TGY38842.1 hypothetical protein E5353_05925 [Bacteroides caecimuris]
MKRNLIYYTLIFFSFTIFFFSCDDRKEDDRLLMNTHDMCEQVVYKNVIMMNGKKVEASRLEFIQQESSSVFLMKMYGIIPLEDGVPVIVEAIPDKDEIRFTGKSNDVRYQLEVEGRYTHLQLKSSTVSNEPFVEMNCKYKVLPQCGLLEKPFIFRLDTECMFFLNHRDETIEWNGQTLPKIEFMQTTLEHIRERLAKEVQAIKLIFHEDSSLDIWMKTTGSMDFTLWMNVQYWFLNTSENLYLELTTTQTELFYQQWTGKPTMFSPPFISFDSNRNLLPLFYSSDEKLSLAIIAPFCYSMAYCYLKSKGCEDLTEEEHDELSIFLEIIREGHRLNSWQVYLQSELVKSSE